MQKFINSKISVRRILFVLVAGAHATVTVVPVGWTFGGLVIGLLNIPSHLLKHAAYKFILYQGLIMIDEDQVLKALAYTYSAQIREERQKA